MSDAEGPSPLLPPPLPRHGAKVRALWVFGAAIPVLAGAALLYAVNPATTRIFPPCPFHALTGLYCPGCGSTRCLHHLLHGRVATAFDLNPLLVVMLPFVAVALAREVLRVTGRAPPRRMKGAPFHRWWVWALLAVVLAFGVARNLPWKPVRWMAP